MQSFATFLLASLSAATAIPVDSFSIPSDLDIPVIGDSFTAPGDGNGVTSLPLIPALTGSGGSIGNMGNNALGGWEDTVPSSDFNSAIYFNGITPEPVTFTQTSPSIADGSNYFSTESKLNTDYDISGVELASNTQDGISSSAYRTDILAQNQDTTFVSGPSVNWRSDPTFKVTNTRGNDNHYHLDYPSYDGGLSTYRCYPENLLCCDPYENLEKKAEAASSSLPIENVSCRACKFVTSLPFFDKLPT